MENDVQYYTRRAAEERQAAARAETREARRTHRLIADRYAVIAREREAIPAAGEAVAETTPD